MHPRTVSTLALLEEKDWFLNVGRHDSSRVSFVDSWKEAVSSCSSNEWKALCEEAVNQYRARLTERDKKSLKAWSEHVRELKSVTIPLVLRKTKEVVNANQLPKSFVDMVQWDILHLCLEAEYADIYPPGFFASQAYWYLNGHFPCGWRGNFPEGNLLVY
jgi:hypothetical protein